MPPPPAHGADGDKPLVLLAQPLFPNLAAALEGRYRLVLAADADAATVAEARVLLVPGLVAVPAELVDRFPALELVAATSVGLDHVDLGACRRRGLAVTNAGAAFPSTPPTTPSASSSPCCAGSPPPRRTSGAARGRRRASTRSPPRLV